MLRESNENALNMNSRDLDKTFGMQLPKLTKEHLAEKPDKTSKEYFARIQKLRDMQRDLLPLYLQAQKVVQRHERVFEAIMAQHNAQMPV